MLRVLLPTYCNCDPFFPLKENDGNFQLVFVIIKVMGKTMESLNVSVSSYFISRV